MYVSVTLSAALGPSTGPKLYESCLRSFKKIVVYKRERFLRIGELLTDCMFITVNAKDWLLS